MINMKKTKTSPRDFSGRSRNYQKNRWATLFSSQRFIAVVLLVFLLIIIFPLIQTYRQHQAIQQEIKDVQKQINNYQSQDKKFQKMLVYFKSDQYLIDQARLNMNMKKPGEEVIVIDRQKNNVIPNLVASSSVKVSNLVKWWHYFFN